MSSILEELRNPICVGVDIGQIRDSTAICVAEVVQRHMGKYRYRESIPAHLDQDGKYVPLDLGVDPVMKSEWFVRHITRLPLGTSYPDVANHLADMLCNSVFANREVRILLDSTGVGRPVYDSLKEESYLRKEIRRMQIKPITFSHGEIYNRTKGILGKAFLVSRLQSLLQSGRVHAPDTSEVKATLEELKVYEIKITDEGKDQYGAFQTGKHDDLATALALSCLEDPYSEKVSYSKRIY